MSENAVAVINKAHELTVSEVKAQVAKVQNLMSDLMQEGVHYGKSFPGDTKKNLLKPGADKLCFMFRLRADFNQEIKELPNDHREVMTKCQIFHIESGQKISEGVGSAITRESKYRWRNASRKCPHCKKETIRESKNDGGFYCWAKLGGCGAKFAENDRSITGQVLGKVENPDIADCYNTILKISKKRAYVDATISACGASDIFSQDADDLEPENDSPKKTGADLAREAQEEPRNVTESQEEASPPQSNEAIKLKELLEEGKIKNGLVKTAETALKNGDMNTIRGILNSYNSDMEKKQGKTPKNDKQNKEAAELEKSTGEILKMLNPDQCPYFTESEVNMERAIAKGADSVDALKNQNERLKKELVKRYEVFVAFEQQESTNQINREFKDDIPVF